MQPHHKLYVGMHDGVCTVTSLDGGQTWQQEKITPLAHAVARPPASLQRLFSAKQQAARSAHPLPASAGGGQ